MERYEDKNKIALISYNNILVAMVNKAQRTLTVFKDYLPDVKELETINTFTSKLITDKVVVINNNKLKLIDNEGNWFDIPKDGLTFKIKGGK